MVAWVSTLLVSSLPDILFTETTGGLPPWLLWAKMVFLVGLIAAGFIWPAARALQKYFAVFLAIYLAEALLTRVEASALWQGWFGGPGAAFSVDMLGRQLRRLFVSLLVIAALLALRYRPRDFFLVKGRLDAPVGPIPWLGFAQNLTWARFGWILSAAIALGTGTFLVIAGRPTPEILLRGAPLLPAVFLISALNAFNEEMTYRAAPLAPLYPAVGKQQSIYMTAAWFGLWHFYGVPYGVVGVIMAGFLGWLLGKSMLETQGFFWPWFIHFWQDVLIFSFLGVGSVVTGGG